MTEKSPNYVTERHRALLDQFLSLDDFEAFVAELYDAPRVTFHYQRIAGNGYQPGVWVHLPLDPEGGFGLSVESCNSGYRLSPQHRDTVRAVWDEERDYRDWRDTQRDAAPLGY